MFIKDFLTSWIFEFAFNNFKYKMKLFNDINNFF